MTMQPRWLAMGVSAAVLLLLMSSPASAQKRGGSGGRGFNTFGAPGFGFGYGFGNYGYGLARGGLGGFIAPGSFGADAPVYSGGFGGGPVPANGYQSFYPPISGPDRPLMQSPTEAVPPPKAVNATVQIFLVDANAELWFNGVKMQQIGQQRDFITPELAPGKAYSYEVRAKWIQNGKLYDKTRILTVQAGEQVGLNFMVDERETLPPPSPKK